MRLGSRPTGSVHLHLVRLNTHRLNVLAKELLKCPVLVGAVRREVVRALSHVSGGHQPQPLQRVVCSGGIFVRSVKEPSLWGASRGGKKGVTGWLARRQKAAVLGGHADVDLGGGVQ